MGRLVVGAGVLSLLAFPSLAGPQHAAPPSAPAEEAPSSSADQGTVEGVTVTARSQEFRSEIDRRSYSVAQDLQSSTGSVADVLRNIPSVEVDLQGNVSLRGDANVTIMIDGKPSGMFRGESRASALQQMSANQIERIEVITSPSAAFNPEGSAGVINLISKTVRKPGYSGTVRASVGQQGRYNTGVSGAYNSNALTLSGDLGARGGDPQRFRSVERREQFDADGAPILSSVDTTLLNGVGHMWNGRAGVDYDLDRKTRLGAQVRHLSVDAYQQGPEHFESFDASGDPVTVFDRVLERSPFALENTEVSANGRRQFAGDDHELTATLRRETTDIRFTRPDVLSFRRPPAPSVFELFRTDQSATVTGLKLDYQRPLPDEAKLKLGYELQIDRIDYDNLIGRGPARDQVDPVSQFTDLFRYRQDINAAYATYERGFGDLTVLAGLRLEQVRVSLGQATSGDRERNDYVRAYPSLHLGYTPAEGRKLAASYSRRVQRPRPQELNPLRQYQDPLNYRQGNPRLAPQVTDAFEVSYERRQDGAYQLATLFYRDTRDAIVDVVQDLGDGVLLTTRENLGKTRNAGLELAANGKLGPKLKYNLTGSVYWSQIDAANLAFTGTMSDVATSGRANLDWQATEKDFVQVSGFAIAKRLTPQGYREGIAWVNLGYRRRISQDLFAVVTVQDLFGSLRDRTVIRTPALNYSRALEGNATAVIVGLTYNFGGAGKTPREPAFDFGGGPTP